MDTTKTPEALDMCPKGPFLGEGLKLEAVDQLSRYQEIEDRYRELVTPKLMRHESLFEVTYLYLAVPHGWSALRAFRRAHSKSPMPTVATTGNE
jgi:spore coat polysaccharide biosynthesis protein SpsF (cytidylyltransferase family)